MGVESTTGLYIDGLNASWPDGVTEYVRDGDDHIRVIKTALKNTFPNLDGEVTLTPTQFHELPFPSGTKMLFMQAAAPTGWTIDTSFDGRALFLKGTFNSTAKNGGETGGSHDPGLMNKVPSHTHGHTLSVGSSGAHRHRLHGSATVHLRESTGSGGDWDISEAGGRPRKLPEVYTNSGSYDGAHTHAVSGSISANGSAANWVPKYATAICASKD